MTTSPAARIFIVAAAIGSSCRSCAGCGRAKYCRTTPAPIGPPHSVRRAGAAHRRLRAGDRGAHRQMGRRLHGARRRRTGEHAEMWRESYELARPRRQGQPRWVGASYFALGPKRPITPRNTSTKLWLQSGTRGETLAHPARFPRSGGGSDQTSSRYGRRRIHPAPLRRRFGSTGTPSGIRGAGQLSSLTHLRRDLNHFLPSPAMKPLSSRRRTTDASKIALASVCLAGGYCNERMSKPLRMTCSNGVGTLHFQRRC